MASSMLSDAPGMNQLNDSTPQQQQYQAMINQGQFKKLSNPPASSLDYLYQAISLIETKNASNNNSVGPYLMNQQLPNNNSTPGYTNNNFGKSNKSLVIKNCPENIQKNILNQQNNTNVSGEQKRYTTTFQESNEQIGQLYNQSSARQNMKQNTDCKRYFNDLVYQQQQQTNCSEPYCNCGVNQAINNPPKMNTINNLISHQKQQHQQTKSGATGANNSNAIHKTLKSTPSKVTKNRRNEERVNERRISNLIHISKSQSSPVHNKKNISKLLQSNNLINESKNVGADADQSAKKVIPSRLEKAKLLARKQQNSLKLNLNTPELQMIESDGLLTPLSLSSGHSTSPSLISTSSPMSQASLSPISPQYSPSISQFPQVGMNTNQQSVFNYYPVELMNNLIPLYLTPYLSNLNSNQTNNNTGSIGSTQMSASTPAPLIPNLYQIPANNAVTNIDQLYFQNLVTAIYTIANYQQQQQQTQHNSSLSNTNTNTNFSNQTPTMPNIPSNYNMNKKLYNMNNNVVNNLIPKSIESDVARNGASESNKADRRSRIQSPQSNTENRLENKNPLVNKNSKSTCKIISYIGSDIESHIEEHFRRSLCSDASNNANHTSDSYTTNNSSKLVINESEAETGSTDNYEDKNLVARKQPENWTVSEEYCDFNNNYECNHLNVEITSNCEKCKIRVEGNITQSNLNGENYDELNYETDELLDYSNEEASSDRDPLSPVSTASYSYSVISQTSDMVPGEVTSANNDLNEYESNDPESHENLIPNIFVPNSSQQIIT